MYGGISEETNEPASLELDLRGKQNTKKLKLVFYQVSKANDNEANQYFYNE